MKKFKFENTNLNQRKAIQATEGPLLIIAGPGTGKTFTLVKRIVYLIIEKKVLPKEIMVATFTEKAAKELVTRVSNELLSYGIALNLNEMYIGTFHSICLRIIKEYDEEDEFLKGAGLLDSFEQVYLVYQNIERFKRIKSFEKHIPSKLGRWRQSVKIIQYANTLMEELVDLELIAKDYNENVKFLGKLTIAYLELLEKNKTIDFASIQRNTFELLINNKDVLSKLRKNISYIMVDEYQDTNYIQEQILFLIADEKKNLCVVGDDDQGLYRFRGATIRNILEFPNRFKKNECKQIYLDINYRSEKEIIDFYNKWMENVDGLNLFNWDKFRFEKKIVPGKLNYKTDRAVFKCVGENEEDKFNKILFFIKKLQSEGNITDLNQIAFLFRSVKGVEAKALATFLESNNIPVYSPRSKMFFERQEVREILGCILFCFKDYLRELKNNSFSKPIGNSLQEYYKECLKSAKNLLQRDIRIKGYIGLVQKEMGENCLNTTGLLDLFYRIISFDTFKNYIEIEATEGIYNTRTARNLAKISTIIKRFNKLHEVGIFTIHNVYEVACQFFNEYLKCLYIDGVGETEDELEYAPSGCVSFLTFHQSKGMEFPVVITNSLKNGPRKEFDLLMYTMESRFFKRGTFEPLEEIKYFDFWRLYYTAFSRAQNLLILAGVDDFRGKNKINKCFKQYIDLLPEQSEMELEGLKIESIKNSNIKNTYSFTSQIQLYNNCSLQYKYFKEFGFASGKKEATTVGSLIHQTLEDINKLVIRGEKSKLNSINIEKLFNKNYNTLMKCRSEELTREQLKDALGQVIRYVEFQEERWDKVWRAENEVNIVTDNYIFKGVIDLIEKEGNVLEIIDFKTGSKPNIENNNQYSIEYKKQLEIYAYLVEKYYGKKVASMKIYYTSEKDRSPFIVLKKDDKSIEEAVQMIEETIEKIENKKFRMAAKKSYICASCDMKYLCKRG